MLVNGPGMIGLDLVIIHKGQGFYREWCTVLWNWLTLWRILLSLVCYQWNVLMFSCRCLSMNMLHWCWWYFHGRVCFITKFRTPSWRKRSRSQQTLIVIQLFHLGRFWGNLLFSEGGFSSNLYIGSWKGLDYRRHRWWGWTTVDAVKPRLGGSFFLNAFFLEKKKSQLFCNWPTAFHRFWSYIMSCRGNAGTDLKVYLVFTDEPFVFWMFSLLMLFWSQYLAFGFINPLYFVL